MKTLLFAVAGLLFVAPAVAEVASEEAPAVVETTTTVAPTTTAPEATTTMAPTTVATTTTTTTTLPPVVLPYKQAHQMCPQWHDLAREVGWPEERLSKLSYIMWRESRCNVDSWYKADPMSGSRGLTQVNGFWCKKQTTWPDGWLTTNLGYEVTCEDLFDPRINLISALAIWNYSLNSGNHNPWRPWAMPKD